MDDFHRYTKEERLALVDKLLEQRYREKATWEDLSDKHSLARSTIRRWRQTDEWRMAEANWRRIMREEARSDVAMIGSNMVDVLVDLASNARSEHVRFLSASKLVEVFGVENELEERQTDQQGELVSFFKALALRQAEKERLAALGIDLATIVEVKPGGMLPDGLRSVGFSQQELEDDRLGMGEDAVPD